MFSNMTERAHGNQQNQQTLVRYGLCSLCRRPPYCSAIPFDTLRRTLGLRPKAWLQLLAPRSPTACIPLAQSRPTTILNFRTTVYTSYVILLPLIFTSRRGVLLPIPHIHMHVSTQQIIHIFALLKPGCVASLRFNPARGNRQGLTLRW